MTLHEVVGLVGVLIVLIAYFMLASKRWASASPPYLIANIVGTLLILFSLLIDVNWPGIAAQLVWIAISLRSLILQRKTRA